jgi:hypothetical protein
MKRSFLSNYEWYAAILVNHDIAIADVQLFTAHWADLPGTFLVMIATTQDTTPGTSAGSPVIFLIPEPDTGDRIRAKADHFAGTAFRAGKLFITV